MNRLFTTLAILAMGLVAVVIWIRQTILTSGTLDDTQNAALFSVQGVLVIGILGGSGWLLRKAISRRLGNAKQRRFEAVRPLRRLLSAVWS